MASTPSEAGKTGSPELAQLIRDRRQRLGMSRQDLAEATGVPYSTIAQIETAYRGVSPGRLGVIARALQLDPKELYDVLASAPSPAPPQSRISGRDPVDRTDDDSWHPNPAYGSRSFAVAAAPVAPRGPDTPEVVERVVNLLSQLPPTERLGAVATVQSRLMADLVREEVRRTRRSEP